MAKKLVAIIGTILVGLMLLAGCGGEEEFPQNLTLTEFPQYVEFNSNVATIDVSWDINSSSPLLFTIDDTEIVDTIVSMINKVEFEKAGSEMSDGNHSSLTFVCTDSSKIVIPLSEIKYGSYKQFYKYPNSDIYNYVRQIGIEYGFI